jgi:hypothetical protein
MADPTVDVQDKGIREDLRASLETVLVGDKRVDKL